MLRSMERPPAGGPLGETDSRVLRPHAGFVAARAIGVRSNSVPVRGTRIKPNVGYCGIGLPETFSTCGLNVHFGGLCRERGSEEREEQSDSEKSSRTEYGCFREGNSGPACLVAGHELSVSRIIVSPVPNTVCGAAAAAMQ